MHYVVMLSLINKENRFNTETSAHTRCICVEIVETAIYILCTGPSSEKGRDETGTRKAFLSCNLCKDIMFYW